MSESKPAKTNLTKRIALTGMMSAVALILMFLQVPVPLMPPFIKYDFSEFPALLAAFAYGPLAGVAVCFVKNAIHLFATNTGGVGELSNFLLGAVLTFTAGMIYQRSKRKSGAIIGAVAGAVAMAAASLPINFFIVYPVYYNFMPKEAIISAYQAIYSGVDGIFACLLIFNLPFTFIKGIISAAIVFLFYKRLSHLLK